MTDFDEEVVNAIAQQPFEEIQKRLQELIDSNSPEANDFFFALLANASRNKSLGIVMPWILKFYRFAVTTNSMTEHEFGELRKGLVRLSHLANRNQDALFLLKEMEDVCIQYGKDRELVRVLISQCEQLEELDRLEDIQELADRGISLGNVLQEFNLVGEAAMHAAMSFFNRDADSMNDLTNNRISLALEYSEMALNRFYDCGESSAAADSAWVISRSLESLEEFESALEIMERGIYSYEDTRNTPEHVLSRTIEYELQRGRMLRLVGRLDEAEACLEKILAHKDLQDRINLIKNGTLLFMLLPLTRLALAWTQYDLKKLELAWDNFCQVSREFYNVNSHHLMRADYGRAQILARVNAFEESIEICKNILERKSNIFPLDDDSMEKNKTIGALRTFTLQNLTRLNNYGDLGYGRFKISANQVKELDWNTKLLIAKSEIGLGKLNDALESTRGIEAIKDFLPTQRQLDKLSLIKAQVLIQLERADEARETLREVEAFSDGFQKEIAAKMLESLETFERYESEGERFNGSKTWKNAEPAVQLKP
jgi:tetratricopeptide (TPR) repeat protein